MQRYQRFLLSSYRAVLFSDSDEIVAPTPDSPHASLPDYAEAVLGRG